MNTRICVLLLVLCVLLNSGCKKSDSNPVQPADPLSQGLVAYYSFDNDTKDHSGNNLNGTPAAISFAKDRNGKDSSACNFNGTNSYVKVPHNAFIDSIESRGEVSIAAWINIRNWYQGWNIFNIMCQYDSVEDKGWEFGLGDKPSYVVGFGGYDFPYTVTLNTWVHVTVTFSAADSIRFYINGSKIGSMKVTGKLYNTTYGPMFIGFSPYGPDEYSNGLIDEFYIYNRVLTDTEVKELYSK